MYLLDTSICRWTLPGTNAWVEGRVLYWAYISRISHLPAKWNGDPLISKLYQKGMASIAQWNYTQSKSWLDNWAFCRFCKGISLTRTLKRGRIHWQCLTQTSLQLSSRTCHLWQWALACGRRTGKWRHVSVSLTGLAECSIQTLNITREDLCMQHHPNLDHWYIYSSK